MADVFLSYAREDSGGVVPMRDRLQALGLSLFVDTDGGIHAGDSFPQVIADQVLASKAVLACWTPHSLTRPWCRRECLLAREQRKLVPVAIAPVGPADLKEFIDASYEDLTDFEGQDQHFGWSQTLRALARTIDLWAEVHLDEAPDAFALAARLRVAAVSARPKTSNGGVEAGPIPRIELWSRLKKATDIDRLNRFAESFPGTAECFEARELIAALEAHGRVDKEFRYQKLDEERLAKDARNVADSLSAIEELLTADADPKRSCDDVLRRSGPATVTDDALFQRRKEVDDVLRPWRAYRSALHGYLEQWRVHPETEKIEAALRGIDCWFGGLTPTIDQLDGQLKARREAIQEFTQAWRAKERELADRAIKASERSWNTRKATQKPSRWWKASDRLWVFDFPEKLASELRDCRRAIAVVHSAAEVARDLARLLPGWSVEVASIEEALNEHISRILECASLNPADEEVIEIYAAVFWLDERRKRGDPHWSEVSEYLEAGIVQIERDELGAVLNCEDRSLTGGLHPWMAEDGWFSFDDLDFGSRSLGPVNGGEEYNNALTSFCSWVQARYESYLSLKAERAP